MDFSWDPETRELNYAYYRSNNYGSTSNVSAVTTASGAHVHAQRRAWNTTCVLLGVLAFYRFGLLYVRSNIPPTHTHTTHILPLSP